MYKIGIVGFGYWGKIIYQNLIDLGYNNIFICDEYVKSDLVLFKDYEDLISQNIDMVFIVVPANNHYDLVKFFLNKGINVFCEKPLTLSVETSEELYKIAEDNNTKLFVDWIFTFNKSIHYIKYLIEKLNLTPINIMMNRLNSGPIRYDTDSKMDLSSHDVSIVFFLFLNKNLVGFNNFDFKRKLNSVNFDSSVSIINFETFNVQINSSWEYGYKDRNCIFQFKEGFIIWDDTKQAIEISFDIKDSIQYNFFVSNSLLFNNPLKDSINNFIKNEKFDFLEQKKITMKTMNLLCEK